MVDSSAPTFFVTSLTWHRKPLFRSEETASLFIDTVYEYRKRGVLRLYEFVVMPDRFHLLLAPIATIRLGRAMQLIKSGFSHEFMKQTGSRTEIWERRYTDHHIRDESDYEQHCRYIRWNPVAARFVSRPEEYPYSSAHPGFMLDEGPEWLKPAGIMSVGSPLQATSAHKNESPR
jgi:putative transposase